MRRYVAELRERAHPARGTPASTATEDLPCGTTAGDDDVESVDIGHDRLRRCHVSRVFTLVL
jgi:hypothetical protein